MNTVIFVLIIGTSATAIIDLWGIIRERLFGIPSLNYGMLGRWIGHIMKGRLHHQAIAKSTVIANEKIIGWLSHYLIGILFAAGLIGLYGTQWIQNPSLFPAITFGIATVVAPFFIMQPGMGAGIAASRTPDPTSARFHSLITHTIFGFGLYFSAWVITRVF